MYNEISFKQTYKVVSSSKFSAIKKQIGEKNLSCYPWTAAQRVLAENVATERIYDCTVLAIKDGVKVLLLHLCPTRQENQDLDSLCDYIKTLIPKSKEHLQAVIFGSQCHSKMSIVLNNYLLGLVRSMGIPCSVFKNSEDSFDVAYTSSTDEWYISSPSFDLRLSKGCESSEKVLKNFFEDIALSEVDKFSSSENF